jgi:hypothetical protein
VEDIVKERVPKVEERGGRGGGRRTHKDSVADILKVR